MKGVKVTACLFKEIKLAVKAKRSVKAKPKFAKDIARLTVTPELSSTSPAIAGCVKFRFATPIVLGNIAENQVEEPAIIVTKTEGDKGETSAFDGLRGQSKNRLTKENRKVIKAWDLNAKDASYGIVKL
jgi:hypothetical protein